MRLKIDKIIILLLGKHQLSSQTILVRFWIRKKHFIKYIFCLTHQMEWTKRLGLHKPVMLSSTSSSFSDRSIACNDLSTETTCHSAVLLFLFQTIYDVSQSDSQMHCNYHRQSVTINIFAFILTTLFLRSDKLRELQRSKERNEAVAEDVKLI